MFKSILQPLGLAAKGSALAASGHYSCSTSALYSSHNAASTSSFVIYKRTFHKSSSNAFGFADFFDKDKLNPDGEEKKETKEERNEETILTHRSSIFRHASGARPVVDACRLAQEELRRHSQAMVQHIDMWHTATNTTVPKAILFLTPILIKRTGLCCTKRGTCF